MFSCTQIFLGEGRILRKLHKIALILAVLTLVVVMSQGYAFALTGSGTETAPYLISTADDLDQFRDIVNGGDNDAWGMLANDIDLSQLSDEAERENWTPIGSSNLAYLGTFNGNGYTVRNLRINNAADYIGFFGYTRTNAEILNLVLYGNIVGNSCTGGIVGYNNRGTIINCTNFCNVSGNNRVGGIVGFNGLYSKVMNCFNNATISGTTDVGGIVGGNNLYVDILNCFNSGTISGNGGNSVGGVIGYLPSDSNAINCFNTGTVTNSSGYRTGGIIGEGDSCVIQNSHNIGNITGYSAVGGVVGYFWGNLTSVRTGNANNCSNSGSVRHTAGNNAVGGVVGSLNQCYVTNCGWLSGTASYGVGNNNQGVTTNVVTFNNAQSSSVVTTTIPSINKTILDMANNETAQITFTTYPSQPSNRFNAASGFMRNIRATSEDTSIASVVSVNQSSGTIILGPRGAGIVKITVTADLYSTNFASIGNYITEPTTIEFSYHIAVKDIPVEGISLSRSTLDLTVGNSFDLTASITPSNATNKAVTWSSSDSSIASVDSSGRVTAKANGIATINVKSAANASISDTCTVTVTTPTSGVTVTPESVSLNTGQTHQLTATVSPATASNKSVTWSTSRGNVATVNSSGLVTAVGNGTATITARTVSGGYTDTCAVTVSTPVTGVSLSSASLTINKGGTHQLTATVSPETASNKTVSWSTSDPDVASVSQSGLVTAVGGGTADITVTTEDGSYTAQCKVTVNVPVTGVQFDEVSASMGMDSSTTLGYTVLPPDASNKSVTWQSSNTAVAMIDADTGVITPVGPGGTEITVTTIDGNFSDTLFLMVTSSLDTAKLTIITESGYCPDFATVYNKASGYVVEYPGIPVGAYGEVEAPVPSGQDTCTVGISLLNTLIAGTSASPGADPESLYMVEGDFNADNVIDGTDYTILVQRMHFGGGLSEYGLTGDINYDSVVDKLDLMMFGSPVAYTGQSRFMQEGYDIESPEVQTNSLRSADKGFWVPVRSLLETKESGEGRYEISLQAPSEPVNMLQIALKGDISETSAAAPEGFELIGAYAEDGKSVVAIGSSEKGGSIVPADVPIVTVKATETPSVIYGEHDTVMQRADEYGIENMPLEMSEDAGRAVSYSGSGGSGCNFGLGALTLLIAAPLLFRNKHGR